MSFVNAKAKTLQLGASGLDTALLLITVEGILHNRVLAVPGVSAAATTDAALAARVKRHLTEVILRLVSQDATQPRRLAEKGSR